MFKNFFSRISEHQKDIFCRANVRVTESNTIFKDICSRSTKAVDLNFLRIYFITIKMNFSSNIFQQQQINKSGFF